MKKICFEFLFIGVFLILFSDIASAHCEIPCGIYDDETRIKMILEHVSTIEKSMNEINNIEKDEHHNSNQLVRWIINKEHHADEIQEIAAQYFMTQRIKLDSRNYSTKLACLHKMLIYAMQCKQTNDLGNTAKLRDLVKEFQALYFEEK